MSREHVGGNPGPTFEALEARQLLSGVTTAAALEPVYLAPAPDPGSPVWRVDLNNDGRVDARDTAARPGAGVAATSTLRIGGSHATDPVPGSTGLSGVVVAGFGAAGDGVFLGSVGVHAGASLIMNADYDGSGLVDQADLDAVLLNWGSTATVISSTVTRSVDLLTRSPAVVGGALFGNLDAIVLAGDLPDGTATLFSDSLTVRGDAIAQGRGLVFDRSSRTVGPVVGFETAETMMEQATYLPLGLTVDANRAYEVRVSWDHGWGDPFAQGVGAAITSSGELALVAVGGYAGDFTLEVEDVGRGRTVLETDVVVVPAQNRLPSPVNLPTQITGDTDGVWRTQLPNRDADGEPVRYDVSFAAPGAGGYRWNGSVGVDDNGVLTIDRQTIEEYMRDLATQQVVYAFDGMYRTDTPFEFWLLANDGWGVTEQKIAMSFAPQAGAAPSLTMGDTILPRAATTHSFEVPAFDAEGDAIHYDVWTSSGDAYLRPFATADAHQVTVGSPWLGIKNTRVRLTMSDGGDPVGHSFVLRASRPDNPGPYVELADLKRDLADGNIITVRLPSSDGRGNAFRYEAVVVPLDANGAMTMTWQEPSSRWVNQAASHEANGVWHLSSQEQAGYETLFDANSRITRDARVVVRPDRLGVIVAPDLVGDVGVLVRATHGDVVIYDAFKVSVERPDTPRSLAELVKAVPDITRPSERRGFFWQLPRVNDAGRTIDYTVSSTAKAWVSIGENKAGQYGVNVVPIRGFGGSFGVTLTADDGTGRVVRTFGYTVAYSSPITDALALSASANSLGVPVLRDVTRPASDPYWAVTLPERSSSGPVLTYAVSTTAGRWARVERLDTGEMKLKIQGPPGFRGSFLVELEATDGAQTQRQVFEYRVRL